MTIEIDKLVRENIKKMTPYSSARHEFSGNASIFLDANENSIGSPLDQDFNRYPDPLQIRLKHKLSEIKGIPAENIFIGNGSDEPIDLVFRIFCEPRLDNVIILPPTYGMYEVCANVNNVAIKKVPLLQNFQPDLDSIAAAIDERTKIIFICSPNNPTGNSINHSDIETILNNFDGIVVLDEAYINFSRQRSFTAQLNEYPNLIVLQTLSKAWGLAGLRIGVAIAHTNVIHYLNKTKYPYNISSAAQRMALTALAKVEQVNDWTKTIVRERTLLAEILRKLSFVIAVFPSDANFLLVKLLDAKKAYDHLVGSGIIVRDRSNVILCEGCLRITVGTPEENTALLNSLKSLE